MEKKKIVKSVGALKHVIMCSILVCVFSTLATTASAFVPVFVGGTSQNVQGCRNTLFSLSAAMAIIDSDMADTETWTIVSGPSHGSLSGFPASAPSTGGLLIPTGFSYTPATGYTGFDTFVININDGSNNMTSTVVMQVKPLPTMTSSLTPPAICDQTVFSYVPTSGSSGATFAWRRVFSGGISNPVATGTGNPNEVLVNTTYYDVPVTYVYTVTAGGCSSQQSVMVNVHPTPRLSSKLFDTTCTGATYSYIPVTPTSGTTFAWSRAAVSGISPAASSGTGNINETLTSTLPSPATVVYSFMLSANGCTSTRNLNVYVIPQPPLTTITTSSPSVLCSGTMFQSFGAGIAPPAGVTYTWSAVNADIYAVGNNGQYILVNFNNPGDASVTLMINGSASACSGGSTYSVSVGSPNQPTATILYYNYQFIYQDNTADAFQWGYDDAYTLAPTVVTGAVFQSYPITSPNLTDRYYWVEVMKAGCTQKVYYNSPVAISNVNNSNATVEVYPNPAGDIVNVILPASGNTEVTVLNMMGQVVAKKTFNGNKIQLDISDMPAGGYMVSCVQDGVKVANARFTRN